MKVMKIKNLDTALRPREKCQRYGVNSLSDKELIAIIIRTGTAKVSCLDIAANLLKDIDLAQLVSLSMEQLIHYPGISNVKAIELLAVFEIAKRLTKAQVMRQVIRADNPDPIVDYMRVHYGQMQREVFVVFYLNNACAILDVVEISQGTLDCVGAYPREIFKQALTLNSSTLIIAHNHPSGEVNPSNADIFLTQKLAQAAQLMDMQVVDHIIVSHNNYFSFNEHNMID